MNEQDKKFFQELILLNGGKVGVALSIFENYQDTIKILSTTDEPEKETAIVLLHPKIRLWKGNQHGVLNVVNVKFQFAKILLM